MPTLRQRLSRIAPYFAQGRLGLIAALLGSLVGAITEPMIPELMKPLLDRGFTAGTLPLWLVPLAIVGIFALRGLAGYIAQYGLSWTAQGGVQRLRRALFARILSARPAIFAEHSSSNLTNTLVYEVQTGATLLVDSLLTLVKDSLTLLALLAYLLWLNWHLTLFVGVLFPAVAWVMRSVGKRLGRLAREGQSVTDALAYVVEENVLAWRIVRTHGAQAGQQRRFELEAARLRRVLLKIVTASGVMTPLTQLLTALALSAVIVAALWQSSAGSGTVGGFVAFITAMLMLVAPVKHLSDVMAPITRGLTAIERGILLLESSPAETGGSHDPGRARGRIALRDVSLRYRDDQALALDGLTLEIAQGQTVALVGPSGAGKTSLINLLPRFVEPDNGSASLDGVALADWDVLALRRQFALVSQEVVLFNDSLAANVALGGEADGGELDRAKVMAALRGAHLGEFVAALPRGIDSVVGHNGNELSGGQQFGMSALLGDAAGLEHDDPVSMLDGGQTVGDDQRGAALHQGVQRPNPPPNDFAKPHL